jgi:uncharacterized linocin/CFP29 family protein
MSMRRKQIRRVHIDGEAWTYIVGRRFVSIRDPEGKRTTVRRVGVFAPYPTPQAVKDYIWQKLHPVLKLQTPVGTAHAKDMLINLFCGAQP